ncbi:P-loop NTPase fold protein [Anabaena catenula]|uniref:KAP NTPase domain-containing protein n=1 Tax=Anabaena catenula FACHB-362 TaxID=2692877 RepID=A0ABR8J8E0_9NOST|nr:P-loop NTPase fold protein [Anabaena catenula]MBD2693937.1 hypothetical protein [Anabaena catenula FACHB-362]
MTEITNKANAGVNRQEAKSIIKRFLDNEHYRVLAVNGKWGIGKTHLVQTFVNTETEGYYLYASVFGISSIEQLKARLIANSKSQESNNLIYKNISNAVEWASRNAARLDNPKLDVAGLSASLLAIAGNLGLETLFHINVKNSIICIDDLERKSKIPLEEILGFVEYLVQECKCKIILIYNEDELEGKDKTVLQDYREKVIDREFTLDPTVDENLDFIFKDNSDIEVIKKVFIKTGTNNIRVIRKTKWLIDELIPLMENWEDSLRHQVIINCIVITVAKLDTDFCKRLSIHGIDPIDTIILSRAYNDQQMREYREKYKGEDQKTSIKKLQFLQKIEEMDYRHLEQLDELISQLVNTPSSDSTESQFKEKGHILNEREKRKQIIKKLDNLYQSKYYNSFADNEQDIMDGIINFLEQHHLDLTIAEFENIERFTLILGLDISDYEKFLLEKILKSNSYENLSAFRNKLSNYPDLEVSFNKKINEYYQTLDITTALKNIRNVVSSSRSPRLQQDIEFLKSRTVDEYCQWLEKGHPELIDMVEWLRNSGYPPAPENLEQAICILAECSRINKIRAKYLYNIDIDNLYNSDNTN